MLKLLHLAKATYVPLTLLFSGLRVPHHVGQPSLQFRTCEVWNLKDVGVVTAKAGPGSCSCTYRASSLFHTYTEDPVPGTEGHPLHKAPSKVFGPMRGPGWDVGSGQGISKGFS